MLETTAETTETDRITNEPREVGGNPHMSTDTNAGAHEEAADGVETVDYDAMLDTLDVAIEEAQYKIESGRVRSPENEKVRIKWVRALAYAVNVRRQVANDRDLQELAEEVERLQEQHERTDL